jgi:5-formyltetrahydrofolate cyclo-ligase
MNTSSNLDALSKDQLLSKIKVRKLMRSRRALLTSKQLMQAERKLAKVGRASNRLLQAKNILSYAPFAGEISPAKLVSNLASPRVHLPLITNFRLCSMRFYSANGIDSLNRYGIEEPKAIGSPTPANNFDVILLPLVAFDRAGNRIGMGRGYYDRALQALSHQHSTRPYLIGVAHHFQEVKSCQAAAWDVSLDAILTDQEFILISH